MGDRRVSDRRSPEKGVIRIPFKKAIIYLVVIAIFIISFSANVVLYSRYKDYKKAYEIVVNGDEYSSTETVKNNNEKYSCDVVVKRG